MTVKHEAILIIETKLRRPISKTQIIAWMADEDIEVLGAVQEIVSEKSTLALVTPALEAGEIDGFMKVYIERCLRENPQGEWGLSRYMAAYELNGWFLELWDSRPKTDAMLASWKAWFARIYRGSNEEIKRAIVDGSLEHFFERPGVSKFFADWKNDPELEVAFDEARA